MCRTWRLIVIALVAACAARADEPFAKVREDIRRSLERDKLPSLAVAVSQHGNIVWEEGFGWANKERKLPATPHTPYSIASISKPITATALMLLVERGLVDLDKPANEYLGDAKLTAHLGDANDATLRRLANHTAGLPLHYQFFYADETRRPPPFDESIRRYGRLLAPPGEGFQYANFGFGVLDDVIRRVAKKSYADFLRDELFQPIGMNNSSVGIVPNHEPPAAERYAGDGSVLPFYDFDHPGASAVFSSAHDLVLFGQFHLKQQGTKSKPILAPRLADEMQRPTADCGDQRCYGVGWFINENEFGYRTVSHTGGMGGVRCRLVLVPSEGIVVATLCNAGHDLPLRIAREILSEMLPKFGIAARKSPEHKPNGDPGKPFAPPELVGTWQGEVVTPDGARRLQCWVSADGDVKIKLANQLVTLLNHSSLRDGLLTGEFAGDLRTADANHRPYDLHLRTRLRGETLNGALTAISLPGRKAGNALSHWVELKRVDPSPQVLSLFNGHDLDGWRIADQGDFEKHGAVRVENGELVLGQGSPATGIVYSGTPPRTNYELSLEARRLEGRDFFCGVTFPVGPKYLSLIIGGWGGGVTGLSNLDGASAAENETSGAHDFQQNRWYAIRLRVTDEKIEAWLDGDQIIDVEIVNRKLSIWWEQEPMRPLGIASWNTQAGLRNLRLKRIDAQHGSSR